jgi:hypothetical protein
VSGFWDTRLISGFKETTWGRKGGLGRVPGIGLAGFRVKGLVFRV